MGLIWCLKASEAATSLGPGIPLPPLRPPWFPLWGAPSGSRFQFQSSRSSSRFQGFQCLQHIRHPPSPELPTSSISRTFHLQHLQNSLPPASSELHTSSISIIPHFQLPTSSISRIPHLQNPPPPASQAFLISSTREVGPEIFSVPGLVQLYQTGVSGQPTSFPAFPACTSFPSFTLSLTLPWA